MLSISSTIDNQQTPWSSNSGEAYVYAHSLHPWKVAFSVNANFNCIDPSLGPAPESFSSASICHPICKSKSVTTTLTPTRHFRTQLRSSGTDTRSEERRVGKE